ncbi:ribonuclease H [Senna tora]|uniref:Ribonuclease H n=1 Tax=Senna tora TaxID=362788 RepID=A0A834WQ06_9FABA|nr:ribonuclease H [Senna tora]
MEDSGGVGCVVTTEKAEVDLNVVATSGEEKPDTIVEVGEERVSIMPTSSSQEYLHGGQEGGFRFGKKLWISKRRIGRWRSRRRVTHERETVALHQPDAVILTETRWRISHCYREANKCADALANYGRISKVRYSFHQEPPPFLLTHLHHDQQGNNLLRQVTTRQPRNNEHELEPP